MKKISLIANCCLLFLFLLPKAEAQQGDVKELIPHKTLDDHLRAWSSPLPVRFTLEESWMEAPSRKKVQWRQVKTLAELEDLLRSQCPDFVVSQETVQGMTVIHLIDKRLVGLPGYPLNERMREITVKGHVADFCSEIRRQFPTFWYEELTVSDINAGRLDFDRTTVVDIRERNVPLRTLLTQALPLQRYHAVLWRARTSLKADGSVDHVAIRFSGPNGYTEEDRKNFKRDDFYDPATGKITPGSEPMPQIR